MADERLNLMGVPLDTGRVAVLRSLATKAPSHDATVPLRAVDLLSLCDMAAPRAYLANQARAADGLAVLSEAAFDTLRVAVGRVATLSQDPALSPMQPFVRDLHCALSELARRRAADGVAFDPLAFSEEMGGPGL